MPPVSSSPILLLFPAGSPCAWRPPYQGAGVGELSGPLNKEGSYKWAQESWVFLLQIPDGGEVSRFVRRSAQRWDQYCVFCSGADVYDRVSTFLETLYRDMEKGGCGENAIIVSHGLFCRLFLMRYYHWKVKQHFRKSYSYNMAKAYCYSIYHRLRNFTNSGILITVSMLWWRSSQGGAIVLYPN